MGCGASSAKSQPAVHDSPRSKTATVADSVAPFNLDHPRPIPPKLIVTSKSAVENLATTPKLQFDLKTELSSSLAEDLDVSTLDFNQRFTPLMEPSSGLLSSLTAMKTFTNVELDENGEPLKRSYNSPAPEEPPIPVSEAFPTLSEKRLMSTFDQTPSSEKPPISRSPSLPGGLTANSKGKPRRFSVRSQVLMRSFAATSVDGPSYSGASSPVAMSPLFQTMIMGSSVRSSPWSRDTGHVSPVHSGVGSPVKIMASFFGDQGSAVDSDMNIWGATSPKSETGSEFFQALDDFQVRVMQAAEGYHYAPDATIISKGDTRRCMFLFSQGRAQQFESSFDISFSNGTFLHEGDTVGDLSLLFGVPHPVSVITTEKSVCVEVTPDTLQKSKELHWMLLLRHLPVLQTIASDERDDLLLNLETQIFQETERIITQNSPAETVYFLVKGTVLVMEDRVITRKVRRSISSMSPKSATTPFSSSHETVVLGNIYEGSIFGEMGVLDQVPRNATVLATGGTVLCYSLNASKIGESMRALLTTCAERCRAIRHARNTSSEPPAKMDDYFNTSDLKIVRSNGVATSANVSTSGKKPKRTRQLIQQYSEGLRVVNCYKLVRHVGGGQNTAVFRAMDLRDGQFYAVKVARKVRDITIISSLSNEVKVLSRINHPHIIRIVEIIDDPKADMLYVVEEFASKGPIVRGLERCFPVALDVVLLALRGLLRALEYLHKEGWVHLDIKPANLLQFEDGTVKLADLGVAHSIGSPVLPPVKGTPAFMPPELLLSLPDLLYNPAMDVWGLGVTIFMLVVGNPPWLAADWEELIAKVTTTTLRFGKDARLIPPSLRHLLGRMLTKTATERASVAEVMSHEWVTTEGVNPLEPLYPASGYYKQQSSPFDDDSLSVAKSVNTSASAATSHRRDSITFPNEMQFPYPPMSALQSQEIFSNETDDNPILLPLGPDAPRHPTNLEVSSRVNSGEELALGIRFAVVSGYGSDRVIEDKFVTIPSLSSAPPSAFFGLYEGSGGGSVAETLKQNFHIELVKQIASFEEPDICGCLIDSAAVLDKEIISELREAGMPNVRSMSVAALMTKRGLYVGWTGICKAVLCRGGDALQLTRDHQLHKGLPVRCFGDVQRKDAGISVCEMESTFEVVRVEDEFLLLGSSGLWSVLSDQAAVNLLRRSLRDSLDLYSATEKLVGMAIDLGAKSSVTVLTVALHQRHRPSALSTINSIRRKTPSAEEYPMDETSTDAQSVSCSPKSNVLMHSVLGTVEDIHDEEKAFLFAAIDMAERGGREGVPSVKMDLDVPPFRINMDTEGSPSPLLQSGASSVIDATNPTFWPAPS